MRRPRGNSPKLRKPASVEHLARGVESNCELASVEEAWKAAVDRVAGQLVDQLLLPFAHVSLVPALRGDVVKSVEADTVGMVEGLTVCGVVEACDRALKDARVALAGLRVTPGLGGKAYFVVTGVQHDVEAGIEVAEHVLGSRLHRSEVVCRPTKDFMSHLLAPDEFRMRGT